MDLASHTLPASTAHIAQRRKTAGDRTHLEWNVVSLLLLMIASSGKRVVIEKLAFSFQHDGSDQRVEIHKGPRHEVASLPSTAN
jgi:hypothetical protein